MLNQYIVWRKKNVLIGKCLDDWIDLLRIGKVFACERRREKKKKKQGKKEKPKKREEGRET